MATDASIISSRPAIRCSIRYSIDWADMVIPDTFDKNIGGNEASFAGDDTVRGRNMVGAWTHTFSPALIGDFRYGYTQFNMALLPTTLTNPIWSRIPGRDTTDPYQPSAPIVGTTGYAGLGNARSTPLIRDQHTHSAIAGISWMKNHHNLKFGAELRLRTTGETASPPGESAFGRWVFDPSYTRNPASPGGTGETIATMLLGYPIAIRRDVFVAGTATLHTKEMNFYVRDEWRVNSKFTANFGVHYEINTPFVEQNDQWVNFDPATGAQLIAGRNGVSRTGNINTDYTAFAPRISLAYQATSKTVIRTRVRSVLLSSGQRGHQHPPVPAASVRLRGQPAVLRQRYSTHYDFAGFPADDVAAGLDARDRRSMP